MSPVRTGGDDLGDEQTQLQDSRFASLLNAIDPAARLIHHWSLTGGVSAQTTALEFEKADGSRERLVIRQHGPRDTARDPDIATHEYQLLQALRSAEIPVPAPLYVDWNGDILGGPAVVVEFVDGEVLTASGPPPTWTIDQMAYWLARIHQFDLASADLSFLVANDYHASHRFEIRPDDSPLVQSMCQALAKHGSVEFRNPPVLLHGDFWRGNLLWNNEKLVAILDWEDAMIGDPIIDLARSRIELHWTLGALARERFTSQYLSFRDIDVNNLAFWDLTMALGFARALPEWQLPPDREQEMMAALEQFVHQANERLRHA